MLLFAFVAFALKATTFGDLNRHADETFYFLVGQRMHEGLVPYVDVWDRKPLGLFLIYYLIAGISSSVLAYQFTASLFAAATAWIIALIAARWSGPRGAVLAGLAYLFIVGPFEGNTGQAPDFYNLFIAVAALWIAQAWDELSAGRTGWRLWSAMAMCGFAATIKHTALFESVFFGLFVLWMLKSAGQSSQRLARTAAICALIGAAPTLAIAAWYWSAGYWGEFWHAMVLSNLTKAEHGGAAWRLTGIVMRALVVLAFAGLGLASSRIDARARGFVLGWLAAAALAMGAMGNFYGHYTLPLLVPLSIATGFFLSGKRMWLPLFVGFVLFTTLWNKPDQSDWTRDSNRSMAELAGAVRAHDGGGGLLVFDAPHYLYALAGKRFLSPLVFPHHLNHAIERDVSHLDTEVEIDRILAARPGVIVLARFARNAPVNVYGRSRVLDYARSNCPTTREITLLEDGNAIPTLVFGDCRALRKSEASSIAGSAS